MTNRPEQNDDDVRDFLGKLEREIGQRPPPPAYDPPPPEVVRMPPRPAEPVGVTRAVRQPWVVYGLIALNVLMFGLSLILEGRVTLPYNTPDFRTRDGFSAALYILGAKWAPAIDNGAYWRLLAPIILHGGIVHLGFNSYALYALGPQTERVYGAGRFFAVYLLAGIAGNVASYVISPSSLAIGASGAIFGLIGALAAFSYSARNVIGAEASQEQIRQLVGMAAVNLVLGFVIPNIDNWAHIGGLIMGGLAGLALAPRYAIDRQLFPPVLVRQKGGVLGWAGVAGLVVVLAVIVLTRVASR